MSGIITTGIRERVRDTAPLGALAARRGVGRGLWALWAARSWWGGLFAVGLAATGQSFLLAGDLDTSARCYIAAVLLLIASFLHPSLPWLNKTPFPVAASLDSLPTEATGWAARLAARRDRAGLRATLPGLALTLILASSATVVLHASIADPLGGWLWAVSLLCLLLTFVGASGWPRGKGLLPGPESDFFARGLPRMPVRLEMILLALVVVVALALRVVNLETTPGVFGDEGERGVDARGIAQGNPDHLFAYGWWGVPNLYFYLVSWMLRIFGDNMVGDRMLSVISGVLAVLFVAGIARMFWGARAGLIAGALLAVSPLALQFSRLAGESTPTGALWAGGFFFLFRGLRYRKPLDWVLAGLLSGFSLYFYAAGKLIIPILAGVGVYCLIRWRLDFFKKYALGFALLGVAFGLTFLPYALFSFTDNWQSFFGRAQETSIFSPGNQAQAFAKYGIAYTPQPSPSLAQTVLSNPLPWAMLIEQQLRVSSEVIYKSGDPTQFYQIREHAGSMLPPFWAALALLGLAYGAWKGWDARFGLASLWFWGGMLGAALTLDTPSVQRLTGAWPALMLFPAVVIDRIWAGAWPVSLSLARRWAILPIAGLLLFFGADGYQEYFVHFASLCPYCDATTQARYAQALGQDYKGYQFGVGGYDVFFGYGSTRFVAKGVEGTDATVPSNFFPITDAGGKGAAFIIYPSNAVYLPVLEEFYPGGKEEVIKSAEGVSRFTSYKLTREQLAAFETLHAVYTSPSGESRRDEPGIGTGREAGAPAWAPPPGISYPAMASWEGGLVAPSYGLYSFALAGSGDARLYLDGNLVSDEKTGHGADLVLAKGIHSVRLTGTLSGPGKAITANWGAVGAGLAPVPARYLFHGETGGLSGDIWSYSPGIPLTTPDLFSGKTPISRRSDPVFGFREAHDDQASFGGAAFLARWQGTLTAPAAGQYAFDIQSGGESLLLIDGQPVVNNSTGGGGPAPGSAQLTAGPHAVELLFGWQSGRATFEWYWTPPGGTHGLVPPSVLTPAARSWSRGSVPDPAAAAIPATPAPPAPVLQPAEILGADSGLKEARGVGVNAQGDVYIADSSNHRVIRLDKSGKQIGTWGSETALSAPGKFGVIGDLAVGADGRVATLDVTTGDVQVFAPDGKPLLDLPATAPNASGIAIGPEGRIWVANTSGNNILRFTADGKPDGVLTGGADGTHARFEQPIDVAVAPDGTAYAVDLRGRIVRLNQAGSVTAEWPVDWGGTRGGSHLAVWGAKVAMTDPDRQRIDILDPASGQFSFQGAPGTDPGQFRVPVGIAAGQDGRLYVMDSDNGRVQVFGK